MNTLKLIIFDWDGTLMDSASRIVSSMRSTAKELELLMPDETNIRNIIGLSLEEASYKLFGKIPKQEVDNIINIYRKYYIHLDDTPTPLFDGAYNVIDQLNKQQYQLAVATGKGINGLERVLTETKLKGHFHAWRGADQAKSKPDPLMLQQILEELKLDVSEALMVGDTSYDLEMAQNIGMKSLGVSYGVHEVDTLKQYQPIAIIDDIKELPAIITNH